jgi:hypothetical protein
MFLMKQPLQTYAAVAAAPAYLSGLTDQQMSDLEDNARQRFCPNEHAQLSAAVELFVHLTKVQERFTAWADGEIAEGDTPAARAANKVKALGR